MRPATSVSRALPVGGPACRDCLRLGFSTGDYTQRRWRQISPKWMEKVRNAEKSWEEKAQEIQAGARKHLFDELEERGFMKDFIG